MLDLTYNPRSLVSLLYACVSNRSVSVLVNVRVRTPFPDSASEPASRRVAFSRIPDSSCPTLPFRVPMADQQPANLGLQPGITLPQPASNPAGEVQDPHFATGPGQSGTSEATLTTTNGSTDAGPNPSTYLASSAVMSEYDALFARLKEKPHDPEGWRRLVDHAESNGEIDKIRAAYDALLKQYPNTVCFWSLICASLSLPSTPHRFSTHLFYLFTCNGELVQC